MNPIDPARFCPIPFLQLQLNPLGSVSACCFSGEYPVGNVQRNTIEEIWNGETMRRWRKEFLTGDIKICENSMKTFGCHRNYAHLIKEAELQERQEQMPRRLDLRLNGQCNLECVMCDVWKQPNKLYDASDFWTIGPEKIFPHLLEVDMLGGEPFIQKDTYRLIDQVLKVNDRCSWGFITNCQYKFTPHLEGYLDRLKRIRHVHMSLDSVNPETYPLIRKNGSFAKAIATLDSFVRYRDKRQSRGDHVTLFASMCVQKGNWNEIPLFLDFCEERNLQPILQNVIGREHLSLRTLSPSQHRQMLDELIPLQAGRYGDAVSPVISEVRLILKNR